MRNSDGTPSIVFKEEDDQNVYIVLDDCRNGRAYRETDVERADHEVGHHGHARRGAIQKPSARRRLQHRREMVAGCLRRPSSGTARPPKLPRGVLRVGKGNEAQS